MGKKVNLLTVLREEIKIKILDFKDPLKVEQIKELYEKLRIPEEFAIYKKQSLEEANRLVREISTHVPQKVFDNILNVIDARYE